MVQQVPVEQIQVPVQQAAVAQNFDGLWELIQHLPTDQRKVLEERLRNERGTSLGWIQLGVNNFFETVSMQCDKLRGIYFRIVEKDLPKLMNDLRDWVCGAKNRSILDVVRENGGSILLIGALLVATAFGLYIVSSNAGYLYLALRPVVDGQGRNLLADLLGAATVVS